VSAPAKVRDTQPSPPPSDLDAELLEALAEDVDAAVASLRDQAHNLETVATGLRREAAHRRSER
jgi:hypothetical protein